MDIELPPPAGMMTVTLGLDHKTKVPVFDEQQMREYAKAAVAAERGNIMDSLRKQADLAADEYDRAWALEMLGVIARRGK
jgi:hypothetical protein